MTNFFSVLDQQIKQRPKTLSQYIKLEQDKPVKVQIISPLHTHYVHWMSSDGKRFSVKCLGPDCPVCGYNISADESQIIPRQTRYICAVVDLTPVRICPHCGLQNDITSAKCANDDTILVDVPQQPSKAVKLLEGSRTFFTQVKDAISLVQDAPDMVPLLIKKSGSAQRTVYTVIPQVNDPSAINPAEYSSMIPDLENTGLRLSAEELIQILNGMSLSDVLASRKQITASLFDKEEKNPDDFSDLFG